MWPARRARSPVGQPGEPFLYRLVRMRPVRAVEFVQDFSDDLGTRVGTNRIKSVADDAVACERVRDRCQTVRAPECSAACSLAPQTFGFELDGEYERVCKTCCRHD